MFRQMVRYFSVFLNTLLLLLLIAFAYLNREPVTIHFYFDIRWTIPLVALIFLVLIFGIAVGFLLGIRRRWLLKQDLVLTQGKLAQLANHSEV